MTRNQKLVKNWRSGLCCLYGFFESGGYRIFIGFSYFWARSFLMDSCWELFKARSWVRFATYSWSMNCWAFSSPRTIEVDVLDFARTDYLVYIGRKCAQTGTYFSKFVCGSDSCANIIHFSVKMTGDLVRMLYDPPKPCSKGVYGPPWKLRIIGKPSSPRM